jgi:hypothetical protein
MILELGKVSVETKGVQSGDTPELIHGRTVYYQE